VRKSDAEADDFETNAVADLRRAAGTYPDDAGLFRRAGHLVGRGKHR
jgi:hypothetical protein